MGRIVADKGWGRGRKGDKLRISGFRVGERHGQRGKKRRRGGERGFKGRKD